MAGWVDSTGTSRGAGGRGFPNRRYGNDTIHGGGGGGGAGSSSGGSRWRGRGRPPQQPHYRYRPVDAAHRHSTPSTGTEPPTASASMQVTHPAAARGKSPAPGAVAPASSNKDPDDKGSRNAANFECNVCFDMAAEPVVTKCGHLFCWECLYQWLHVHSQHRECPVCKGQVAEDAVIPIYGRGGSAASVDTAIHNAPPRPTGARVESSRQQQQNNHHPHTWPYQMVYVDDGEEDEGNPFEFPSIENIGFGGASIRDAVRSFISPSFDDVDMDEHYDEFEYSYEFNPEDYDEIYDYDPSLMGFPVLVPADNPGSSQAHSDLLDIMDMGRVVTPVDHPEYGYSGPNSHNRGQHRRRRTRASANQSATDAMVTGGSSGFHLHRDYGANYNNNGSTGASSRPSGGWAERRGRSNRNSNSAGGRGVQDGRRQRTNYS